MKKYIAFWMIMILLIAITACKTNQKIEVVIGMWPESANTDDIAMFNTWKERFEADYPEYEIKGEAFTYSVEAFYARANSKTLPTVFQTWFTEPQMIVSGGHAKDITEIINHMGWFDKMDPELREYLTFDQKLYGIPRDGYGLGIIVNLQVFADAGLVSDLDDDGIYDIVNPDNPSEKFYPVTMEELYQYAETIKENTGIDGLIILNVDKNGGWQYSNYAWAFGAELQVIGDDQKVHANLNSSEAVQAMNYLKQFYDNDLVPIGNMNYSEWATRLGNGQIAMAIAGNDVISNVITQGGMNRNDIAFIPIPEGPGGQYTLFGGTPYMFSAYDTDEAVEGAIKFLEYMGRSPEISEVAQMAMREGLQTATRKNMLILPEVRPWVNSDYTELIETLNAQYVNVSAFHNFQDFYDQLPETRRREEPYYTQYMYELLDQVVVSLKNPGFDVQSSLNSKQELFESYLREQLD
ncbi:MAG: ABC transporter substrate-binding protein [Acholeplasmataceae bacterium]|jgi:ABC-type glycerol-3-phosphate transport system substrate-binding protein|nr:ABC transporter substrate-binding protein [Acholeplasmataceae bacterium]